MQMESITIKDVAHLCGVGVSTVSRAINNHPDINPETKDMIMQVIKDHNYVPNNSARNLKRSEARAIAVLIKGISNPIFNKMIKIFEEEIQKKKYSFVLQHVDERQDEVDVAIQLEKEKRLNGIVFLGGFFSHSDEKLVSSNMIKIRKLFRKLCMLRKFRIQAHPVCLQLLGCCRYSRCRWIWTLIRI